MQCPDVEGVDYATYGGHTLLHRLLSCTPGRTLAASSGIDSIASASILRTAMACPYIVAEFEFELVEAADDAADSAAARANPVLMSSFQNFFVNFLGESSRTISGTPSRMTLPPACTYPFAPGRRRRWRRNRSGGVQRL